MGLLWGFVLAVASTWSDYAGSLCFTVAQQRSTVHGGRQTQQPVFWLGLFLMFLCGPTCQALSLMYAPVSILSPIGSLTLLWHVLMSPVLLREPLLLLDAVACSVVVAGVCVTAVFGNQGGVEYTIASIAWLYSHASCTAFLVATGIVMLASAVGAAIASGKTRRFALVAIPGIAAGTAMVFTKATVEIMSNHAAERWVDPIALFNIAAMLLATAVQVIGLVVAAKHCDAMFVVPVFLAVYTVQATMAAFFCFREFASMQTLDVVMFVVGVGIVTAGCWLFTQRRSTDGVHEGAEDDGEGLMHSLNSQVVWEPYAAAEGAEAEARGLLSESSRAA